MDAEKALEKLQKQYKRQNDFIKNSYDRVNVLLPLGTKARITATGKSLNSFISEATLAALDEFEKGPAAKQEKSAAAFMAPPVPAADENDEN